MKKYACSKCGKKAKKKLEIGYVDGKRHVYYLCGLCHYNYQRAEEKMMTKFFKEAYKEN